MAGYYKWLGFALGLLLPIKGGALLGFLLGLFADAFSSNRLGTADSTFSGEHGISAYQFQLLLMTSAILRANGQVRLQAVQFVYDHLEKQYGSLHADRLAKLLKQLSGGRFKHVEAAKAMAGQFTYETAERTFSFLRDVAIQNGVISQAERLILLQIAAAFGMKKQAFERVMSGGGKRGAGGSSSYVDSKRVKAYKTIGVELTATMEEVRKAYRKQVLRYHPDRYKGSKEEAEKVFQNIRLAYEYICNERGEKP